MKKQGGFTLIELIIVLTIIMILTTIVLVVAHGELEKSRDTRRITDLAQIEKALQMYYLDNGQYPAVNNASTTTTDCGVRWCNLEKELDGTTTGIKYIDTLPHDPLGLQSDYRYFFDVDTGDNNQTYLMMARLESSKNEDMVTEDGGAYNTVSVLKYYEIGSQVKYCMNKYGCTGTCTALSGGNAWEGAAGTVCVGGD